MSIKIIGAGLGRTGTMSLKKALEHLSGEKCFHMVELLKQPKRLKHFKKKGKLGKNNWEQIFEGYTSVTDFPCCMYYKELSELYPEAKVILTVREPEKWYQSTLETIYRGKPQSGKDIAKLIWNYIRSSDARKASPVFMHNDKLIWEGFFEGKFEDKKHAIEIYNRHIEEVKKTIPKDRLLVFSVKEGWEPLCDFLRQAAPNIPFPRTHQRTKFNQKMDLFLNDGVLNFKKNAPFLAQ